MSEPLAVFDGVVKRFGSIAAVKHMDLTIEKGEFVALMGPSGCGKTTTLRMLAGLEAPSEGEVRIAGRVMNDVAAHERDAPMVWQSLALFPFLNVREPQRARECGIRAQDARGRRRRAPPPGRQLGLKQSFFIPGWCLETYPRAVEAILKGGHEIGCHRWIHENPLERTREQQARDLDRSLDAFERIVGRRPTGYRAPVYQVTEHTVDLLLERGFVYESSMMADDVPYLIRAPNGNSGGDLVEIPPHWGNDDWPPFAHYGEIGYMMPVRGPTEGLAPFFEEFEAAYEAGGFWMAVVHLFLTGRLARWRVMERWLEAVLERGDVWFATLDQIAFHVLAERDRGADIRVERYPCYTERQK